MIVDNIFDKYSLNINKLKDYGFIKANEHYHLKKELVDDEFYVEFIIDNNSFQLFVYEQSGEEYLPIYIKHTTGNYISKIKHEVSLIAEDIIKNCFEFLDIRKEILEYVDYKYHTIPEYPWKNDKQSATLKINGKWYGIMMTIPYKSLNINKEGSIDVINVKNEPDKILKLIDHVNYFPAYHMNKKYWLSIVLDKNVDFKQVKMLIDDSYYLVNKRS